MSDIRPWIQALTLTRTHAHDTLPGLLDPLADRHGDRAALSDEASALTYRGLSERAHRYAAWAVRRSLTGQTVGLLLHNCAEYPVIWLGLTRAGCTVALLNTNLRGEALAHSIRIAAATHVIASLELLAGVECEKCGPLCVHQWPFELNDDGPLHTPAPAPRDVALLIYTSGTTGLPKTVRLTHARITEWSFWFAGMMEASAEDRLYDCLPLYHSTGGVAAIGAMLVSGGCTVIRRRFSASGFWPDVVQSRCTIFQYIGELGRYLALSPPNPSERLHHLRLAVGNGLQADVWRTLKGRFGIPRILEFYAATEGVLSLYNLDGEPGAIGQIPRVLEPYFAIKLIRVDAETGEPIRDSAGWCVEAEPDEAGEAIAQLTPGREFDGYDDARASSRKVIRDVFKQCDRWFRSGDLMRKDPAGRFFFVDRLGDTFRWKGENVSCIEVANVLRTCPGVTDAVVYGVVVEDNPGRAGMAALVTDAGFDLAVLGRHVATHLPVYARPLFVRLCPELETTGTFKLAKTRLIAEGYGASSDPVFSYDPAAGTFAHFG